MIEKKWKVMSVQVEVSVSCSKDEGSDDVRVHAVDLNGIDITNALKSKDRLCLGYEIECELEEAAR